MVAIISMATNALGGLFVGALKAFFSLISWFLKHFFNGLKLLFCVLPVTGVAFAALFVINIVLLLTGSFSIASTELLPEEGIDEANRLLNNGSFVTAKMYSELIKWWNDTVYVFHGKVAYFFLLLLTVLMFIPVVSVLLCISVFASFGIVLFFAVCADGAIYLIRAVLGKSIVKQVQGRYFMLFREAGKKHDEKTYEKWLRRHHDEFENDEYDPHPRKSRNDAYYEDDEPEMYYEDEYYEDEEYDDEEYDEDDYYEDELEDEYEDEEFLEDSEYEDYDEDEDYDDYEDRYDSGQKRQSPPPVNTSTSFNFFAGCNSKESLDRKYKSLVKLYHPDNMDGDTSALQEINVQYDKAKKSGRFN